MQTAVKIWPRKIGKIDNMIYGHFTEHLGRCIYDGIYNEKSPKSDSRGFRRDVMDAVKNIKCPILRWPGGNFVSAYHWQDGIGPLEKRPQLLNYIWGGVESNRFGTDEFIEYCREIDAEPYLAVSLGTATLDEAMAWLEYCNLDTPTKFARMRRENGHPEPYHVKYWGIGNEVYGPWQVGHCSAAEYAERLRQYTQFMKGVDPSIKVIAVGADNPDWDMTVLKHVGHLIDYISIHQYHGCDDYFGTVASVYYCEQRLKLLEGLIKHLRLDHVKISFDEWNIWYKISAERKGAEKRIVLLEEPYALKDGLFAAGIFAVMHRMANTVQMANLAQMVNALGMIKTKGDEMVLTPIYHAFDLFVNHTGRTVLDMAIGSETYEISSKTFVEGRNSFKLSEVPYVDGSATFNEDKNILSVALINYYQKDVEVSLDLSGIEVQKRAVQHVLTGSAPDEMNDFENPERIKLGSKELTSCSPEMTVKLDSMSANVIEFSLDGKL